MEHLSTATKEKKPSFWIRAFRLYRDGFRNMSRTSKLLWVIILVKLFIMFAILRLFFFPNVVKQAGDKEQQIEYVVDELTKDQYNEGEIPLWYDQKPKEQKKQQE